MAGLVPQHAQAIAQILVQYMSGTGACVIDLPAAAPALNICNSIEIRLKQQDVIERVFDSICIAPTLPMPAEPKPSGIRHPPPSGRPPAREGNGAQIPPWRTKGSPEVPDDGDEEACNDDVDVVDPPLGPDDPARPEPPSTRVPVQERPAVPQPTPTSLTPIPTPPSVTRPLAPPAGPGNGSTSILTSSRHLSSTPSPSPSSSPSLSLSSLISSFSSSLSSSISSPSSSPSPSSSRIPPTTTPPSDPEPSTLTKVPPSSPDPPSPSPSPTTPVRLPDDDPPEPPSSADPDPPPRPSNPPQPPPPSMPPPPLPSPPPTPAEAIPDPCESAYTTIDVGDISDVDPGAYTQYLHLVGMDLAQHHPKDKFSIKTVEIETEESLVHQYRVRCDVGLPEGPVPAFPGPGAGEERTTVVGQGHRACLEACERAAILMADDGLLRECLGVAYRDRVDAVDGEGEGECRFWWADKRENMFLPVNALPSMGGEDGRWQVIYM
ncbi:hypothetical protein F4859DRAFT_527430 [Xylaria cf. heliscus]|nr:hypothetical protein F4859DRAFT_527430 [Xylaria cf. heliscus]